MSQVGTLNEQDLHAALKHAYARPGDAFEVPLGRFVVDILRADGSVVEVQTRGLSKLKRKLTALLDDRPVTVVLPVASEKYIVRLDTAGTRGEPRRSPRRGRAVDAFAELVGCTELLLHPGFAVDVVLTVEEEVRQHEPGRAWRRKGWVIDHRRLLDVHEVVRLEDRADLLAFLPGDLPPVFTTADLARGLRRPRRLAQQVAYCLRKVGAIVELERTRAGHTYARADA